MFGRRIGSPVYRLQRSWELPQNSSNSFTFQPLCRLLKSFSLCLPTASTISIAYKGDQSSSREDFLSDLLVVVGDCLGSTAVAFGFSTDIWVGQNGKNRSTLFRCCDFRIHHSPWKGVVFIFPFWTYWWTRSTCVALVCLRNEQINPRIPLENTLLLTYQFYQLLQSVAFLTRLVVLVTLLSIFPA